MLCHRCRTGKRTVKTLGRVRDVGDTEVAREDDEEWDEVHPRAGSAVGEQDLKDRKACIHHVFRNVAPC